MISEAIGFFESVNIFCVTIKSVGTTIIRELQRLFNSVLQKHIKKEHKSQEISFQKILDSKKLKKIEKYPWKPSISNTSLSEQIIFEGNGYFANIYSSVFTPFIYWDCFHLP